MFKRLCTQLEGYIDTIIISFVDRMKNTRKNEEKMGMIEISEEDMREVGKRFSSIAEKCDIHLKMCAETVDLSEFGILNEPCFGPIEFYKTTGKIKKIKKGNLRKNCDCLSMADIGAYNCCAHLCRYCYANYDEDKIHENMKLHDPESTMILGHLNADDIIKIRK